MDRSWVDVTERKSEISRKHFTEYLHRDGNNRQPEYPLYPSGFFYPASPVEIASCLNFLFLL